MVDARHSVTGVKTEERNVLDQALEADDDEILKNPNLKAAELSNVQITVGGDQLGTALGSIFNSATGEEGEGGTGGEEEAEGDEGEVDKEEPKPMTEQQKIALAKRREDERKSMRERKRKELEQKFLKEKFAERKKLQAAKRSMDPRAYDEIRQKIHKVQTERLMDDADGKFELTDQELDAAIADEQRTKRQQQQQQRRQLGQLMGMTKQLMSSIPKGKQQQMSQMMGKLGIGNLDKLMQKMMMKTQGPKEETQQNLKTTKPAQSEDDDTKDDTTKNKKAKKAAKKRAKRLRQKERKQNRPS